MTAPAPLPVEAYRDLVARALAEDLGRGDATSAAVIDEAQQARGVIQAKAPIVANPPHHDMRIEQHLHSILLL